jgi:hypothetical protein
VERSSPAPALLLSKTSVRLEYEYETTIFLRLFGRFIGLIVVLAQSVRFNPLIESGIRGYFLDTSSLNFLLWSDSVQLGSTPIDCRHSL